MVCASDLSSTSKESLKEDFSTADPTDLTSVGMADASNAGERAHQAKTLALLVSPEHFVSFPFHEEATGY
jgi:hypothetical protein